MRSANQPRFNGEMMDNRPLAGTDGPPRGPAIGPESNWNQIPKSSWDFREIRSFTDACKKLGLDYKDMSYYTGTNDEVAYKKLKVIIRALNDGWEANFANMDVWKYYPWYRAEQGTGLIFSMACPQNAALMVSGDFMCSKTGEIATYAAEHFQTLYIELLSRNR